MAKIDPVAIEVLVLYYANKERKHRKILPLNSNFGLVEVARKHSATMAKTGHIWHGDGVKLAPWKVKRSRPRLLVKLIFGLFFGFPSHSGENCAMTPLGRVQGVKRPIRTTKDVAKSLHKSWMSSKGHRENILHDEFNRVGTGVKRKGNKFYATQLFYG